VSRHRDAALQLVNARNRLKTSLFRDNRVYYVSQKFIERFAICAIEWQVARQFMSRQLRTRRTGHAHGERNMPRRSRLPPVELSEEEHRQLEQWARQRRRRALALRARIVLSCRDGRPNCEVARRLSVTTQTVGKWRGRFVARRLRGLLDEPRSGAPRSISDAVVESVLAKTLHEHPPDAARWSSRRLASALGISQRAVLRIWRTFEL
jgi:transposase